MDADVPVRGFSQTLFTIILFVLGQGIDVVGGP